MNEPKTLKDAAVFYARRGWRVFPIKPNAKAPPLITEWQNRATCDLNAIDLWWEDEPLANIGLATGRESGVWVLDVDVKGKSNGILSLEDLCEKHGDLPPTWCALTPSGGFHYFFRYPSRGEIYNKVQFKAGLDTRGHNGYVLLEPSRFVSETCVGAYSWTDIANPANCDLADAPDWLLELVRETARKKSLDKIEPITLRFTSGSRNDAMTRIAGAMRRQGSSADAILSALRTENAERCEPPLDERELENIARSISRYEPTPDAPSKIIKNIISNDAIEQALNNGEQGMADLFASLFSGRVLYDHNEGQYYYFGANAHHWQPDTTNLIVDVAARELSSHYLLLASHLARQGTKDKADAAVKMARVARTQKGLNSCLFFARANPRIAFNGNDWDNNHWLIACPNGVLDLRARKFRDGKPDDFIKSAIPTPYDPTAKCGQWMDFLDSLFTPENPSREECNNAADILVFLYSFFGYCMTGDTRDHVFPIFCGSGRNGKGTLTETLMRVMDGLWVSGSADSLMDSINSSGSTPQPFVYELQGKRLIFMSEGAESSRLNTALMKRLTGGDTICCRTLHSKPKTFRPTHHLVFYTNPLPRISADDQAAWDRIILVPFNRRFVSTPSADGEAKRNENLMAELLQNRSGILNWLINGCYHWQDNGLTVPNCLKISTSLYRDEEDVLGAFLEKTVEYAPEPSKVLNSELYRIYKAEHGKYAMGEITFTRRLKARYNYKKTGNGIAYEKLVIKADRYGKEQETIPC